MRREGIHTDPGLIPAPTCLALSTLRYMPDGCSLRWPADLHERLRTIAAGYGLPLLNMASVIEKLGQENSLAPSLAHYSPASLTEM